MYYYWRQWGGKTSRMLYEISLPFLLAVGIGVLVSLVSLVFISVLHSSEVDFRPDNLESRHSRSLFQDLPVPDMPARCHFTHYCMVTSIRKVTAPLSGGANSTPLSRARPGHHSPTIPSDARASSYRVGAAICPAFCLELSWFNRT